MVLFVLESASNARIRHKMCRHSGKNGRVCAMVGYTSSKKVGNAVSRNRAKRRIKSLFCSFEGGIRQRTYVFVAKSLAVSISHDGLKRDFVKVLTASKSLLKEF